jgi:Icc-related predicted phosphoesterase
MRIMAVSDLHGDLEAARRAIERFAPEGLLCCGDWGDELSEADLAAFPERLPTLTTFGNHDAPLAVLARLRNRDGSAVLLDQGEVRDWLSLRVAAIGGIWAKSHKKPWYVTDEDVAEAAARIAARGPVDILMTHGCPIGLADLTPSGRHGGQRCFLRANQAIRPRLHLCGHLHAAQQRTLRDGRQVLNVGTTAEGWVGLVEAQGPALTARLERFPHP